jgi:hypothetical protein
MVDYATLPELFPTKSGCTLYRWRVQGKVRKPDLTINGRDYYRTDVPLRPNDAAHDAARKAETDAA